MKGWRRSALFLYCCTLTVYHPEDLTTIGSTTIHEISNGICKFSPTSTKGKWIFLIQTVLISFIPIALLIIQNSFAFNDMLVRKQNIEGKERVVSSVTRKKSPNVYKSCPNMISLE